MRISAHSFQFMLGEQRMGPAFNVAYPDRHYNVVRVFRRPSSDSQWVCEVRSSP